MAASGPVPFRSFQGQPPGTVLAVWLSDGGRRAPAGAIQALAGSALERPPLRPPVRVPAHAAGLAGASWIRATKRMPSLPATARILGAAMLRSQSRIMRFRRRLPRAAAATRFSPPTHTVSASPRARLPGSHPAWVLPLASPRLRFFSPRFARGAGMPACGAAWFAVHVAIPGMNHTPPAFGVLAPFQVAFWRCLLGRPDLTVHAHSCALGHVISVLEMDTVNRGRAAPPRNGYGTGQRE